MIKIVIGIVIVLASLANFPSKSGSSSYFAGALAGTLTMLAIGGLLIYSGARGSKSK